MRREGQCPGVTGTSVMPITQITGASRGRALKANHGVTQGELMTGYFPDLPYTAAIVGAASGIGRQTALLLAGEGVSVGCIDRDGDGAKRTAESIAKAGGK